MLNRLITTAIMASLAVTANAAFPTFHIENFVASNVLVPSESNSISFKMSHRGAVPQQGGEAPHDVAIAWDGYKPPACFTHDTNYEWYSRIAPGSWSGVVSNFTLELYKHHIYRAPMRWGSLISYVNGSGGYTCSRDDQSTSCTFQDDTGNMYEDTYEGEPDYPSPVC